ncbi:ZIP family metal transporter [Microbacteriaceae bacterium 4G12]
MELILVPVLTTLFTFGGLLTGGIIGIVAKQAALEKMYSLYALCGGILVGLLGFELIPETFAGPHLVGPILGVIFGVLCMQLVDQLLHDSAKKQYTQKAWSSFLFLAIAICIHNLPTGMAIGTAFSYEQDTGISFLLVMIFHHIPEGLALIIPFLFTEEKLHLFLQTILFLSLILGLGTFLGTTVQPTHKLQTFILGSAIGMISYVVVHEMLWKAKQKLSTHSFVFLVSLGIGIVLLYIRYFIPH